MLTAVILAGTAREAAEYPGIGTDNEQYWKRVCVCGYSPTL